MSSPSDGSKAGSSLQTIIVSIVLALAVGGSAPWWWNRVFPDARPVQSPTPSPTPSPDPSRPLETTPRAYMGPLEGGTNRPAGDLSNVGIQVNSAAECSDLCLSDLNCKAMTFVKHADANGGICWLKGSIPSPTPDGAMVSAVKRYSKQ